MLRSASSNAAAAHFRFDRDTFAFANLTYLRHPEAQDLYASHCFQLAHALRQFFQFARFDPRAPRLSEADYVERVKAIAAHAPWEPALPENQRVVIPGFADLREFSAVDEAAVKQGLGSHFWTLLHWTNWRVVFPVSSAHQARVATDIVEQLQRGELVQLLVTNLPKLELNHGVVAFAYTKTSDLIEFKVWDPNRPDRPSAITFDQRRRRFWATELQDTAEGPIRVFRMSYSALL